MIKRTFNDVISISHHQIASNLNSWHDIGDIADWNIEGKSALELQMSINHLICPVSFREWLEWGGGIELPINRPEFITMENSNLNQIRLGSVDSNTIVATNASDLNTFMSSAMSMENVQIEVKGVTMNFEHNFLTNSDTGYLVKQVETTLRNNGFNVSEVQANISIPRTQSKFVADFNLG